MRYTPRLDAQRALVVVFVLRFTLKTRGPIGHILDTGITCFGAITLGISTAAQYRQICKVGTLLSQP